MSVRTGGFIQGGTFNSLTQPSSSDLVTEYGDLYVWGVQTVASGCSGVNGNSSVANLSSPVQVGTFGLWKSLSTAESSLGVKSDGTLWGVGINNHGALGQNDIIARSSFVQVGAGTDWSRVHIHSHHALAVKTDGTLWACGRNTYGQLGDGTTISRSSPVQIGSDTNWLHVAGGYLWSLGVKTDGTLWTWGNGSNGALGLNNTTNYSTPKQVGALTTWTEKIGWNDYGIYAVKTDGTLWSWGINNMGQVGDGTTANKSSPVQIGSSTDWATPGRGQQDEGFCVKADGSLFGWGRNQYGSVGDGSTTQRNSPVQIGALTNWSYVDGGGYFAAALKTNGTVWTWGRSGDGRLGLNNITNYSSPKQVGTESNWVFLAAGSYNVKLIKRY